MTGGEKRSTGRMIYAASEQCADMLYACGFMAPDPFLWFSANNECGILVSALEVGRARNGADRKGTVLSFAEARGKWGIRQDHPGIADYIAALAASTGVQEWEVPADFPLGLARKLAEKNLRLTPVDTMFPQRSRKTAHETEAVRAGIQLAEAGLRQALELLAQAQPGRDGILQLPDGRMVTAELLQGEINAEIARLGGTASRTITAPGRQAADPHQTGTGPVRAGEPLVLDIFPRVDRTGYHGDLTRTVVKGSAPAVVRKAFEAVLRAQEAAIAAIRPGIAAADIHRCAAAELARSGHRTDANAAVPYGFFHGLGHGLGLEVHELPRVNEKSDTVLAPGHVITVEPGLYYPEWGGVRLEDVVAVTDEGCENLTRASKILEIE